MTTAHQPRLSIPPQSAFAGFRFPSDVIVVAVRWYLRFGLSYRRGHYELAVEEPANRRVAVAFDELASAI
jgi:transposase-like protein